jgi:glucosamine 6-phosphate synthetase-like amidotransferase/phosphosugar isomerase protein
MSFRNSSKLKHIGIPDVLKKHRNMFTKMLVEAQARGRAATGIFMTKNNPTELKPKTYVLKAPVPASEFVKSSQYKDFLDLMDQHTYYIVGHTRAVTGDAPAKSNKNNHPHISGGFIGVHNGGVHNYRKLYKEYKDRLGLRSTCDSELLFAFANKFKSDQPTLGSGAVNEAALEKALQQVSDSSWFAVTAMNTSAPAQLLLAKDNTTPLHLFWIDTYETAYFSSAKRYVLKSADESAFFHDIREMYFPSCTILTLDSTTKAPKSLLLASMRRLKGKTNVDKTSQAYKVSQGLC